MKKWINVIGFIFLFGLFVILWSNYINPCSPPDIVFVDTCRVDTIKIDTTLK